jgi:gliding motility-associated peptidyl-prolyl isomerase
MKLYHFISFISFLLVVSACKENPARMPVSRKTGTFLKESVSRNKDLIAIEEAAIDSVIKSRPDSLFKKSQKGYQYKITKSNPNFSYLPQVYDEIIYTRQQLGPVVYKVDKQDLLIGLQDGIKRLKAGDEAIFYFPSHLCYGYKGDDQKIGTNYPLKIEVFVEKVEKQKP